MTCRSALLLTLELLGSLWKSFKAAALAFCWGLLECISLGRVRRPDERARVKERLRAQLAAASESGRENVEAIVDVVAAEKSGGLSLEEPISPSKVETRSSSSSSSSSRSSRSGAPLTPVSPSAASLRSTGATTTDMAKTTNLSSSLGHAVGGWFTGNKRSTKVAPSSPLAAAPESESPESPTSSELTP